MDDLDESAVRFVDRHSIPPHASSLVAGCVLQAARERAGLGTAQVASAASVGENVVHKAELGEPWPLDPARLTKAYGLTADEARLAGGGAGTARAASSAWLDCEGGSEERLGAVMSASTFVMAAAAHIPPVWRTLDYSEAFERQARDAKAPLPLPRWPWPREEAPVVLEQTALLRVVGGPQVMAAQMGALAAAVEAGAPLRVRTLHCRIPSAGGTVLVMQRGSWPLVMESTTLGPAYAAGNAASFASAAVQVLLRHALSRAGTLRVLWAAHAHYHGAAASGRLGDAVPVDACPVCARSDRGGAAAGQTGSGASR